MGAAQLTAAPDASGQLQMTHCIMEAADDKIPMRHSIVAAAASPSTSANEVYGRTKQYAKD